MFRPRVLIIAEAANPEWVSVPGEGWSHSRALSAITDAHIVTQVRNAPAFGRMGLDDGDFTAIDSEAVARPINRISGALRGGQGKGWTTGMALGLPAYYYFEHLLWERFGAAIRAGEYDIVHRLTPLSPTYPSLIARKCRAAGVPFVMGPLNGGVPWPRWFDSARRREKEWLSYVRGAYRLLPGYRSTREAAAAIICGSKDTLEQVPARYREKCVYIPENAIDPARFSRPRSGPTELPLRVVFVGRLVPYKGADMLIEAAAPLARAGRVRVEIIGDGPEMPRLRALASGLDIAGSVEFVGWVPHEKLQDRLRECHVFGFPSVREFGGAVVLEAMAMGLAPVVVAYGGPRELVTDETGYRVPIGPRPAIIRAVAEKLGELAADPAGVAEMGRRARERVMESFTWEAKARQVLEVYAWVLGKRGTKPAESEFLARPAFEGESARLRAAVA